VLAILAGSAVRYCRFRAGRSSTRPSSPARRAGRGRLPAVPGDGLRRRRPARLPGDRGRSARSGARARRGTDGILLVAGSVQRADQIRDLAAAGADAFTIGSAAFDGSFAPRMGALRSQLRAVIDACR